MVDLAVSKQIAQNEFGVCQFIGLPDKTEKPCETYCFHLPNWQNLL
jgi:hypothetical protein